MWNGFAVIACRPDLLEAIVNKVDAALNELSSSPVSDRPRLHFDDFCLGLIIKGVCLRQIHKYDEAQQCFQLVLSQ
jgi:hypothetical protein